MKTVYVTVGLPRSNVLVANKVTCNVANHAGETIIQVAKKCRKALIETCGLVFERKKDEKIKKQKPSNLFWMVFEHLDDELPCAWSANTPHERLVPEVQNELHN